MDDRDRLLLTILRRDARRPIVALARDINLSRSATQERLQRLQSRGVIRGFTTVEGDAAGVLQSAYLTIAFSPGYRCAQLLPKIRQIPGVGLIHSLTGSTDLLIRVDGESVAAIETTRSAIAEIAGIGPVSTSVVLERHLG
ncbi:MAG: Lrp/AsnC family transcriptional regulator [Sphingomicrobium sp.]